MSARDRYTDPIDDEGPPEYEVLVCAWCFLGIAAIALFVFVKWLVS